MSELLDQVRESFQHAFEQEGGTSGPVTVIRTPEDELAPGFMAMREFYEAELLVVMRRCYRHYAGSALPTDADVLVTLTADRVMLAYTALLMSAFADGVLIGHQQDHAVKMHLHFQQVGALYGNEKFRETSVAMATGFADDAEVLEFFSSYIENGMKHMTHASGFVHQQVDPGKIWDVWLLIGNATVCAAFLAGHRMGTNWRERDVLDGIEIASLEGSDGSEGKA